MDLMIVLLSSDDDLIILSELWRFKVMGKLSLEVILQIIAE